MNCLTALFNLQKSIANKLRLRTLKTLFYKNYEDALIVEKVLQLIV